MAGIKQDLGAVVLMERKHIDTSPHVDLIAWTVSEQEESMRNSGSREVTSSIGHHVPPHTASLGSSHL